MYYIENLTNSNLYCKSCGITQVMANHLKQVPDLPKNRHCSTAYEY
jgi:ribosomal protein S27AE